MADIGAALVAGSATIVGVVAGAGLTYWLGSLNRRHQEKREDDTRWYEARLEAYSAIVNAATMGVGAASIRNDLKSAEEFLADIMGVVAKVQFVGSAEAVDLASRLFDVATSEVQKARKDQSSFNAEPIKAALFEFRNAARRDLGH
jgi:hypothetical protein